MRSFPVFSLPALTAASAAVLLAGCAGMQDPTGLFGSSGGGSGGSASAPAPAPAAALPERGADSGPSAPTAVIESSHTMDGAILPVARGQTRTETRADMQRTDSIMTFDNWLIRRFAGDGRSAGIVRLDRNLLWNLDLAKKTYTECPLLGCGTGSGKPAEPERPDQPKKPSEPTCPVTVKVNDLKVDATGEKRVTNGFTTDRHRVTWQLDIEDGQGGRNSNLVSMDLWTTPETAAIREVQAIDAQFARRYAAALTSGDGPMGRYLPKNVTGAMSLLLNRIDPKDKRTAERWAAEMRKVHGYPIVTTLSWTTQGQVCGDAGGQQGAQSTAAGIGSMLGGLLGGKSQGGAAGAPSGAPLISFTQEVKTLAVKPVANSVFTPPADFQRN